jgi:imidazole glycerol-phosphate synthase subunit HisH
MVLRTGVPFLGICLGMQLLASSSAEGATTSGLGWIPGDVRRLVPTVDDPRVPHVGWNEVRPTGSGGLFAGTEAGTDFYFVHSYHLVPDDPTDTAATTPYADGLVSSVAKGQVFGVQFHPEKSQRAGFAVLGAFLEAEPC